jgi:hypothetical protein
MEYTLTSSDAAQGGEAPPSPAHQKHLAPFSLTTCHRTAFVVMNLPAYNMKLLFRLSGHMGCRARKYARFRSSVWGPQRK